MLHHWSFTKDNIRCNMTNTINLTLKSLLNEYIFVFHFFHFCMGCDSADETTVFNLHIS